ncbi:MAG TPA: GNAT family N-acetyltransferase [Tissierellaceae bacterium]|nr:GNAT family N-acetyltransferase [Tissierellaceae bacterium]
MRIKGKRVIIRPLILEDVYSMRNWGYHSNPLLADYNFPIMDNEDIKKWYEVKTKSFFNKYYGILNKDNRLIGYIGIKGIKFIRGQSTLGIVLDPNYINKGYGTEVLKNFLNYYFTRMKMKIMYLEVTKFNTRAYQLYKNMGFKLISYYLDEFFNQDLDLNNNYYLQGKSGFVIKDGKIYNYIYKMELDKNTFLKKF